MISLLNLWKTILTNAQVILIALVIGLTVGASGALYTKAKFDKANRVDALVEARKADVTAILDSQKRDNKIQGDLSGIKKNARGNTARIGNTVFVNVPTQCPEEKNVQVAIGNDSVFLTIGDVRMLNNIRSNTADSAAPISDAEGRAASEVAVKDLIESDSEVSTQYNELAIRHNALVDYIQNLAKKLNDKILSSK